jgi:hypothetical protein
MKKLIFILLCFVSCSGIEYPVYYSSVTVTGLYKSIETGNNGLIYSTARGATSGTFADANTAFGITTVQNILGVKTFLRIGFMFDISTLPSEVVLDSATVKVYCLDVVLDGGDNLGVALYDADAINCTADDLTNYAKSVGSNAGLPTWRMIAYKPSVAVGYQTFTIAYLPTSGVYGSQFVAFGLGSYKYDYVSETPPLVRYPNVYWNLFSETNRPEITIYYHSLTAATKKIKIIGII